MILRNNSDDFIDQRYFPRWTVSHRVLYQNPEHDELREAYTRDLSCSGTCLKLENDSYEYVQMKISLCFSEAEKLTLTSQVMWSVVELDQRYIGLTFTEVSQETQDLILKYAFELNKEKLVDHWFEGW